MTSSFVATAQKHDYYGNAEEGAQGVKFTVEQKNFAEDILRTCQAQIDRLWFDMFNKIQEETGLPSEEVYLLIQKVQYRGKRHER